MLGRLTRLKPRKTQPDTEKALRFIVSSASVSVPYYRDAFAAAAMDPRDVCRIEDLARFPITHRENLLSAGSARFLRRGTNVSTLASAQTTGTCGTPLTIYMSRSEALFRKVALLDSYGRNTKIAVPMSIADVGTEQQGRKPDLVQRLGLVKVHRVFRVMPLQEQINLLLEVTPTLVEGRPARSGYWRKGLGTAESGRCGRGS